MSNNKSQRRSKMLTRVSKRKRRASSWTLAQLSKLRPEEARRAKRRLPVYQLLLPRMASQQTAPMNLRPMLWMM